MATRSQWQATQRRGFVLTALQEQGDSTAANLKNNLVPKHWPHLRSDLHWLEARGAVRRSGEEKCGSRTPAIIWAAISDTTLKPPSIGPVVDRSAKGANTHNRGVRFPIDPIRTTDVAKMLTACQPQVPGRLGELAAIQLSAIVIVLHRSGVRISELLALREADLIRSEMAFVVRHGKGDKFRIVMMDEWGWRGLERWLGARRELPPGPVFCVMRGLNAGVNSLAATDARRQLRELGRRAGLARRAAPHQFRHGFSVEGREEGIDLLSFQRQLGHARLDVTQAYFAGVDHLTALKPFAQRPAPTIPL